MEEGYIKFSRKILRNEFLMEDEKAYCLFTKLLLCVDYKTGTMITGRLKLAKLTGYNKNTVYKVLRRLEREHMVELESTASKTKITILNWKKFQGPPIKEGDFSVTTREQLGNSLSNNQDNSLPINKNEDLNNMSNNSRIDQVAGGNTIQEEEKEYINNTPSKSSEGTAIEDKDAELRIELEAIMKIINPSEKLTNARITLLRARKKDNYSFDEIKAAAFELSKSDWHKENKQMSIDNLLRPSKFGNWYQKSIAKKTSYVIPGSVPTRNNNPLLQDKELTPEQKERGQLIKQIMEKGIKLSSLTGKTNQDLKELLSVK